MLSSSQSLVNSRHILILISRNLIMIQMSNIFNSLALDILQNNSETTLKQFEAMILDWQQLEFILQVAQKSTQLMFVTVEILSKAIIRGDFLAVDQTRSEDGEGQRAADLQRLRIYSIIMRKVYNHVISNKLIDYLSRSCLNLVTLCMKAIFQRSLQVKLSNAALQQYIWIILPGFIINQQFTNNFTGQTVILPTKSRNIPEKFSCAMNVLTSLMDYVTTNAYFKSYYQFRRNIYTFRNSHLPIMLNISVDHLKLLFGYCDQNNWALSEQIVASLSSALSLLDTVFMYPFTLSLHQYDQQLEPSENISGRGNGGQIYFPNYFRNVLADRQFISNLSRYCSVIMNMLNIRFLQDIKKLVRILGRMSSSSGYSFNSDQEKICFRWDTVAICVMLADSCRLNDSYLLNSLADVLVKVILTYSLNQFNGKKSLFLEAVMRYADKLSETRIILSQGKKNQINSALQMVSLCLQESVQLENHQIIKLQSQKILEKLFMRISNNDETLKMMKQLGQNNPNQIEVFQQIFCSVPSLFKDSIQKNLSTMISIDFSKLAISSRICWLHFASAILPFTQGKIQQTKVVLQYFQLAKQTPSLASLHYIYTLTQQIMLEMEDGISVTILWKNMEELTNESFSNFILFVLKSCFNNFTIPNNTILDYSLFVFKSIYYKLKKNDKPQFQMFYSLVMQLVTNMNGTVFVNPKFFKKRSALFSVISIIWVNSIELKYTYQIYQLIIKQVFQQKSIMGLMKYIIDITGLLEPIQVAESFSILAELAMRDLAHLLPQFMEISKIQTVFSEVQFLKIFLNLVFQLCNDQHRRLTLNSHSKLPFAIYDLFYPYLVQVINYDFQRIVISIWNKFINLNPMGELLPLSKTMKQLDSPDYESMLRQYFSSLHRCKNLEQIYQYIEGSVQWMAEWWEEIMERKLKPNINIKQIVQARIWTTKRQRQNFGKMLYAIGRYDSSYWTVPSNCTERIFLNNFIENYI